eukprot:Hpha_TRINITY_DN13990_c0_g3::TRINITY_DN13990_c0_g3_i1::g.35726::m.35726
MHKQQKGWNSDGATLSITLRLVWKGGGKVVKIGDFGLSGLNAVTNGRCNSSCGTPYFMAPEVWRGGNYTDKCDVFSVGTVFYQLVAFRVPFPGSLPWCRETRRAVSDHDFHCVWGPFAQVGGLKPIQRQIVDDRIMPPTVPAALCEPTLMATLHRMMSKDISQRPTVGQVLRSRRLAALAQRVDDALGGGIAPHLVEESDWRHLAAVNPLDAWEVVGKAYTQQVKEAEVFVCISPGPASLSIHVTTSHTSPRVGAVTYGSIVEVLEQRLVQERTPKGFEYTARWFRLARGGWVPSSDSRGPVFLDYKGFKRLNSDDSESESESPDDGPREAVTPRAAATPKADAEKVVLDLAAAKAQCPPLPAPAVAGRSPVARRDPSPPPRKPAMPRCRSPAGVARQPVARSPPVAPRSPRPSPRPAQNRSPSPPPVAGRRASPVPVAGGPRPARSPARSPKPKRGGSPAPKRGSPAPVRSPAERRQSPVPRRSPVANPPNPHRAERRGVSPPRQGARQRSPSPGVAARHADPLGIGNRDLGAGLLPRAKGGEKMG